MDSRLSRITRWTEDRLRTGSIPKRAFFWTIVFLICVTTAVVAASVVILALVGILYFFYGFLLFGAYVYHFSAVLGWILIVILSVICIYLVFLWILLTDPPDVMKK